MDNFSNTGDNGGFTLVEMMIVVAIVGILAAIAIPQYMSYVISTKIKTCQTNMDIAAGYVSSELKKEAYRRTGNAVRHLNRGGVKDPYNASHSAFVQGVTLFSTGNCQIGISNPTLNANGHGVIVVISGVDGGNAVPDPSVRVYYNVMVE